jgi:SAM-dependent methyltransferase
MRTAGPLAELFSAPLMDLAEVENPAFAGVLTPAPEIGAERLGVDSVFLEGAEDYYRNYAGFAYWGGLVRMAMDRAGAPDPSVIVEFGSGFGNATIPMLEMFPAVQVAAIDISPNLLAILKRLVVERGFDDRCIPVAMDALKPYVREDCADLVVGAAILHHLTTPGDFIDRAMKILKPGGIAVFFEPMEGGNAVLRMAVHEVAAEARRRGEFGPLIEQALGMVEAYAPQIFRDRYPNWADRNDKWVFPRSSLDAIAKAAGAELDVLPLHDNQGQFRRHFTYMLEVYANTPRDQFPDWAWAIFDRYDNDLFSPQMLTDLAIEACLIFRKRV